MSGPPLPALEALLAEVEQTAADIARGELAAVYADVTTWALECCRRIRDALTTGDAAGAAYAGCQLGERLAEIRERGDFARRAAAIKSPEELAHERDVERRKAFLAARNRGFSTTDAYEKAGAALGVSPKTIARAVNGH
jgi:hypothetical protein